MKFKADTMPIDFKIGCWQEYVGNPTHSNVSVLGRVAKVDFNG